MKLGLWFNPTVAAVTSRLAAVYASCRITRGGELPEPREIWESGPTATPISSSSRARRDEEGRAVIEVTFAAAGGRLVFFGV